MQHSCTLGRERTSSAEMQAAISAVVIVTGRTMWKANPISNIQCVYYLLNHRTVVKPFNRVHRLYIGEGLRGRAA